MSIHFDRPVGAAGDVKELEYISALHQTDLRCVRTDGSLRAEDIQLFLLSRYGIDVTVEHVRDTVIQGLAGGGSFIGQQGGTDEECVDLMEMVTILLIPTLLKAAQLEASDEPLHSKLALPRPGLLDFVLNMILQDVTGDQAPKELNSTLVKDILRAYGEFEIAQNDKLVEEMVRAAKGFDDQNADSQQFVTRLDLHSFAQGLTYDLKLYDLNNEVRVSSNYDDIFLTHNASDLVVAEAAVEDGDEEEASVVSKLERDKLSQPVQHRFTASSIDFAAGTYRSKGLTVLLWAAFIVTYFAYDYNYADTVVHGICTPYNYTYSDPWTNNQEAIGCQIYSNVYKWLVIFVVASLYGIGYVGLGSIGNSIQTKWFWSPLIGMAAVCGLTLAPYWNTFGGKEKLSKLSNTFLKVVSLVLGMVVCFLHLMHALALLLPGWFRKIPNMRRRYFAATGTLLGEVYIKQAAAHKLSEMVRNAVDVLKLRDQDGVVDTNFGHGLLSFSKHGKRFHQEGGYRWTWKRVFNNELLNKEGIWFSARFLASNIAQYIVSVFVLLAGIGLTTSSKDNFNKDNAKRTVTKILNQAVDTNTDPVTVQAVTTSIGNKISDYLVRNANCTSSYYQDALDAACHYIGSSYHCDPNAAVNYVCALVNLTALNESAYTVTKQAAQTAYLQAAGFDASGTQKIIQAAIAQATNNALDSFYPSRRFMIVFPVATATVIAFLVSLYLATTYLPSVTSTTLKLRSGVIPSLRDKNFHQYRVAADQVTIVTGSMFWGALISSAVVGGLVALVIFLFIWQVTVVFVQRFLAVMVGILTIILIKLAIVLTCRCTLYRGFYRRRPTTANLSSLALECSNFALSAGFVFLRMVKLLFTAAIFIGRIDTPFLAPGVGKIGPVELDYYPYIYRKDILASEAHRHPYIETLGVMYLMKLRYGENFGKTAGSCWRLLFVYALMPWLHRYRILARPDLLASQNVGGRPSLVGSHLQSVKSMRLLLAEVDDGDNSDDEVEVGMDNKPPRNQQDDIDTKVASAPKVHSFAHTGKINRAEITELKMENERLKKEIDALKSQLHVTPVSTRASLSEEEQSRLEL